MDGATAEVAAIELMRKWRLFIGDFHSGFPVAISTREAFDGRARHARSGSARHARGAGWIYLTRYLNNDGANSFK